MKTLLCTLYNEQTKHFSPPLLFENKEQAVFSFIQEVRRENSELANIKDSLSVFATGEFDHKKGTLHPFSAKKQKFLISGKEILLTQTESQKETN